MARGFLLGVGLFFPLMTGAAQATELTPLTAPSVASPGQPLTVSFNYQRTAPVEEKRLVFLVDLHDANTDVKLHQAVLNNSNLGYTDMNGTLAANFNAPPAADGEVYVNLWAVPWSVNRALVEKLESYPTDGTFTYDWNISRPGDYGVTQNVVYQGFTVCPVYPGNTTYCSGVAFEVFILGWNDYNAAYGHSGIGTITSANVNAFRQLWYGITDAEKLAARAIPQYNAGIEITDFEEFQKGDAIQLWRTGGSGHNPIFMNWVRNPSNEIIGVRYWGSQSSSNGIGYRTEYFSGHGGSVRFDRFYAARSRKPRDQADYAWALGSASTKNSAVSPETWSVY